MPSICVVGLGRMGTALARAFLDRGYATSVWNRTPEKAAPLAALGARTAPLLEDAVAGADVVIVNVIDYAAADALLRTPVVTAALKSKLLVQLTSGSPDQAREAGRWATSSGIDYLDGAIMATPNFIAEPSTSILYSGPYALFEKYRDVFRTLGGASAHVGEDLGHASALDVALLSQLWGTLLGTLQAISVSEAEGISLDTFATYLKPFKPVIDLAAEDLIARTRDGRTRGDEQTLASIAAHHSAFQHLLEITADRKLNRALPDALGGIFKAAIAKGHLHDDFAALVPFMR